MQRSRQRLIALILKEAAQLLRDRRTLMMVFGLPLIELFLFGYAVSLTVYHIPTAIVDQNKSPESRDFIQALVNSQYFDITEKIVEYFPVWPGSGDPFRHGPGDHRQHGRRTGRHQQPLPFRRTDAGIPRGSGPRPVRGASFPPTRAQRTTKTSPLTSARSSR